MICAKSWGLIKVIAILSNTLFVIGFSFIVLFLYSLSKHRNRVSGLFSLMCLAIAIYIIGYGGELQAENLEQIKLFIKMEYFGAPFMTAFWLLFSYKFYFNKNPTLKLKVIVMIIPLITLFLSSTNEYHQLIYTNISVVQYHSFIIADLAKGPWYFVNVFYSYIILTIGSVAFYKAWRNSLYAMGKQSFLMFIGTLFPGIMNIIYLIGLAPYGLDLTPFGLCILAVLYFIALFRYDFLDMGEIIKSVAFSKIKEGIIVIDDKNRLIDFNNAAKEVFNSLKVANIGLDITTFENMKEIVEHKSNPFEMKVIQDEHEKYYEFRTTDLTEKNRIVGYVFFIRDITKQREMIKKLDTMASYDDLTKVYNRRRLMEEGEKELLRVKRYKSVLSVLMIDIDFFKNVNDRYGHLAGDEVIKAVINACKERIRGTDVIGRYGGEEFMIILPEADLENALSIAEHIRKHIEDMEIMICKNTIKITVSIGVASTADNNEEINIMNIINRADLALYNAKSNGRNRVSSGN